MNKTTIALLAAVVLASAGCRSGRIRRNGHIVTDTRDVSDFSEIEADGGFYIEWKNGPPSLSVTTDDNLLRYVTTENIDHRLRLHSRGNLWPTHHINIAISSTTRTGAKLTGAARPIAKQLTGRHFPV